MTALFIFLLLILVIASIFFFAPRPTLDPTPPKSGIPDHMDPEELERWLIDYENSHGNVIEGAEATIRWADKPAVTDLCIVYVHGFSASRQETAPVTDRIAEKIGANVLYMRLAGHGLESNGMNEPAEAWLQNMIDGWEIASRIGRKVVFVATSTGAPLSLWLSHHVLNPELIHAFVFLSPNFKIRHAIKHFLTLPWSRTWLPLLVGKELSSEPENEKAGRYWTHRYATRAVIEMQKVIDWLSRSPVESRNIPLVTLYMEDDPTIDHNEVIVFHETWDAEHKRLHQVTIDADNPQHVFAGDMTAPHRNDWAVEVCTDFLESIPPGSAPLI